MLRDETFPVNYLISQLNLSQHRFNDAEQQAGNNKSNQNIKSLCSKKRPHDIAVFTGDNIFYLGFQSYTDKCQTEKNSTFLALLPFHLSLQKIQDILNKFLHQINIA